MEHNDLLSKRKLSDDLILLEGSPANEAKLRKIYDGIINDDVLHKPSLTLREMTMVMKKVVCRVNNLPNENPNNQNICSMLSDMQATFQSMRDDIISSIDCRFNKFEHDIDNKHKLLVETINTHKQQINNLAARVEKLESREEQGGELADVHQDITSLKLSFEDLQKHNKIPEIEFSSMKDEFSNMVHRLDARERYERKNDIIISNLFIKKDTNIDFKTIVLGICSFLNVAVCQEMLQLVKVLNRNHSDNNYTDILVRFSDFGVKSSLMKSYFTNKNLNNRDIGLNETASRIYFNDNLTPHNAEIFKNAKKIFRQTNNKQPLNIKSIFIFNGQIYLKKLNDERILLDCMEKLNSVHSEILDAGSSISSKNNQVQ
jgi:hypothetical protein